jgi:hypothetical protein
VRPAAAYAVFYAAFGVRKVASAAVSCKIQRAVAEKAVEILLRNALVAGKIFAFFVLEKLEILAHGRPPCGCVIRTY